MWWSKKYRIFLTSGVDHQKALDNVRREQLLKILEGMNTDGKNGRPANFIIISIKIVHKVHT